MLGSTVIKWLGGDPGGACSCQVFVAADDTDSTIVGRYIKLGTWGKELVLG